MPNFEIHMKYNNLSLGINFFKSKLEFEEISQHSPIDFYQFGNLVGNMR